MVTVHLLPSAERAGFEPATPCGVHDFQSCALDQLCDLSSSSKIITMGRGFANLGAELNSFLMLHSALDNFCLTNSEKVAAFLPIDSLCPAELAAGVAWR